MAERFIIDGIKIEKKERTKEEKKYETTTAEHRRTKIECGMERKCLFLLFYFPSD